MRCITRVIGVLRGTRMAKILDCGILAVRRLMVAVLPKIISAYSAERGP